MNRICLSPLFVTVPLLALLSMPMTGCSARSDRDRSGPQALVQVQISGGVDARQGAEGSNQKSAPGTAQKDATAGDSAEITGEMGAGIATRGEAFTENYTGIVGVSSGAGGGWAGNPFSGYTYSGVLLSIATPGTVTLKDQIYLIPGPYDFYSLATNRAQGLPTRTVDSYPMAFGKTTQEDSVTGGDLVFSNLPARAITTSNPAVQLDYTHLYALTRFELKQGEISLSDFLLCTPDISGAYSRGRFDLRSGISVEVENTPTFATGNSVKNTAKNINNSSTSKSIKNSANKSLYLDMQPIQTGADYYMLPQEFTSGSPFVLNVTVGTKYRIVARAFGFRLSSSSLILFRATINVRGLELGIDGWRPGGEVDNGFGKPGLEISIETAPWLPGGSIDNGFGGQTINIDYTLELWKNGDLVDNSFGGGVLDIPVTYQDWTRGATVDNEFGKNSGRKSPF